MSVYQPIIPLTIIVTGGSGEASVGVTNIVTRTIFDGPDSATYDWLVTKADGLSPIAGRSTQYGDKIITEEYPVQTTFKFKILNSDTDGTWTIQLCLWPR